MNKNKLYECQIPFCYNRVKIRSKVKSGEYKGKYACGYCKTKYDGRSIKRSTKKAKVKRKEERSCLPEFFKTAIVELKKNPLCENCGCRINYFYMPQNNIAHILSKRKYKSVMCHPENYVLLCDSKDREDGKSCHKTFDNKINDRPKMPVFSAALKKFEKMLPEILEKGNEFFIFEENLQK